MGNALEWFQCKKCGRRHRWTAEIAGTSITCHCGTPVSCPRGASAPASTSSGNSVAGRSAQSFSDTVIEDTESPSALSPFDVFDRPEIQVSAVEEVDRALSLEEITSARRFFVWFGMMLFGLTMLIHALITQFWWYITLAVIFAPVSFWMFHKARRRWQRGRPFFQALVRSLGG